MRLLLGDEGENKENEGGKLLRGYKFVASDVDECRALEVFDTQTNRGGLPDRYDNH